MIHIETQGADAVVAALERLAAHVTDMTPTMQAVGQKLEGNIRHRFEAKIDPAGHAWEPYKAVSAAIHQARHGSPPTGSLLQRKGILQGSVEHHASAHEVEVGLSDIKAQWHEFGTTPRTSKAGKAYGAIPRRGMVFGAVAGVGAAAQVVQALSASDEADVLDVIEGHIKQALNGLA